MAAKVTGRIRIAVGDTWLPIKANAKAGGMGLVERNEVMGEVVLGYSETAVAPYVEFTLVDRTDISLLQLHAKTDVTVIFQAFYSDGTSGKTYIGDNFVSGTPPEVTAGEGETPFRFFGGTEDSEWEELF